MSVLVSDNDLVAVTIHYLATKNKYGVNHYKIIEEEESKKLLEDPKMAPKVHVLNTQWKPQTWQAQNELFSFSSTWNPHLNRNDTDWNKFRALRLNKCLVRWDLTDDNGRIFPVNDKNLNSLHSSIANALSNRYDQIMSVEEDEMGESQPAQQT